MEMVSSPSLQPLFRSRPKLDIHAMKLILDGLNPVSRRVLILLPCGDKPVGMRVSTVVKGIERMGMEFILSVKEFSDKTGFCTVRRLTFNLGKRNLVAGVIKPAEGQSLKPNAQIQLVTELVECFMVLDTKDGMTVPDLFRLYQLQFPNAHEVFVE